MSSLTLTSDPLLNDSRDEELTAEGLLLESSVFLMCASLSGRSLSCYADDSLLSGLILFVSTFSCCVPPLNFLPLVSCGKHQDAREGKRRVNTVRMDIPQGSTSTPPPSSTSFFSSFFSSSSLSHTHRVEHIYSLSHTDSI